MTEAHTTVKAQRRSLWHGTDYGWWLCTDTGATLASSIADFALPLITLSMTHSATLSSAVETLLIGVQTVMSLAGGVITDRYDRKRLVILWAASGALLLAAATYLDLTGLLTWKFVLLLATLLGVRAGLLGQTSNAMLRGVVSDDLLPRAMSLNSARDSTVNLISGPFSGLLMTCSQMLPLITGAVLNLVALCSALPIRRYWKRDDADDNTSGGIKGGANQPDERPRFSDAFSGLVWLVHDRFQRRLLLAAALTTGASNAFLLVTTMYVSDNGTHLLSSGLVNALAGAGMLIGSAAAVTLIERVPSGILIATMFATLAVGFTGAALTQHPVGKTVFILIAVLPLPAGSAATGGLQNILVGNDKLGRLNAALTLTQYGSYAVLAAVCGWAMDAWGYATVCCSLALLIVIGAAMTLTMRALITLPVPSRWQDHIGMWNITRW